LITEDRVKLIKEAGVHIISFAIENGNEKTRKEILDRDEPNELIEKGCKLLHRYGIKFRMQNMLGLPVDNPLDDALETLRFNIKTKPSLSWCSLLQPYPGTAIADYVVKKGFVKSMNDLIPMIDSTFFNSVFLPIKDSEKIVRLHRYWSAIVRWPWLYYIARILIHFNLGIRFTNWIFEISKEYINNNEKLIWMCEFKHTWKATYSNVKFSSWCPECYIAKKWKTQNMLFNIVKEIFYNMRVIINFNDFEWLRTKGSSKNQELDIFVSDIKVAIEYDGKQHFEPVRFGGISFERAKENLKNTKRLHKLKNKNFFITQKPPLPALL
ncbi:hypothetical protein LCGC14_2831950, partial [marine sediment metagenome]